MKLSLFLALIILLPILMQNQTPADPDAAPDVEVRKFSWNNHRPPSPMTNENQSEYTTTQVVNSTELSRQERANRNSVENQSRDLRMIEEQSRRDIIQGKPVDMFRYKASFKNRGSKVIKAIFWDYQFSEPADPDNPSRRQFRCVVKIKPDESKNLEAFTTRPPVRVVSAQGMGKTLLEKLVVNRVEFSDGTSWQRANWVMPAPSVSKEAYRSACMPL